MENIIFYCHKAGLLDVYEKLQQKALSLMLPKESEGKEISVTSCNKIKRQKILTELTLTHEQQHKQQTLWKSDNILLLVKSHFLLCCSRVRSFKIKSKFVRIVKSSLPFQFSSEKKRNDKNLFVFAKQRNGSGNGSAQ